MQIYMRGKLLGPIITYCLDLSTLWFWQNTKYLFWFFSKYSTIDPADSSTAELCDASGSTGYESCDINTNESTFYTLIHSYQAHNPGRITFTASNGNPISVKHQTEADIGSLTDESLSLRVCAKFGLYHKIENITEAIEKASSETGGNKLHTVVPQIASSLE